MFFLVEAEEATDVIPVAVTAVEKAMPAGASEKAGNRLLQPPTPIVRADNWPTLPVQKTTLEDLSAAADEANDGEAYYEAAKEPTTNGGVANDWDESAFDETGDGADELDFDDTGDIGWGDELDDLGDLVEPATKAREIDEMAGLQEVSDDATFKMPTAGRPPAGCWVASSSHAADHIAAGGASSAMQLLNRQIAVSEFSVLRDSMIGTYVGSIMSVPGEYRPRIKRVPSP